MREVDFRDFALIRTSPERELMTDEERYPLAVEYCKVALFLQDRGLSEVPFYKFDDLIAQARKAGESGG